MIKNGKILIFLFFIIEILMMHKPVLLLAVQVYLFLPDGKNDFCYIKTSLSLEVIIKLGLDTRIMHGRRSMTLKDVTNQREFPVILRFG